MLLSKNVDHKMCQHSVFVDHSNLERTMALSRCSLYITYVIKAGLIRMVNRYNNVAAGSRVLRTTEGGEALEVGAALLCVRQTVLSSCPK